MAVGASALKPAEVNLLQTPRCIETRASAKLVGFELRRGHLLTEAIESPWPAHRNTSVVKIPAAATGAPDGVPCGRGALRFEAPGCLFARTDFATVSTAHQFDQL